MTRGNDAPAQGFFTGAVAGDRDFTKRTTSCPLGPREVDRIGTPQDFAGFADLPGLSLEAAWESGKRHGRWARFPEAAGHKNPTSRAEVGESDGDVLRYVRSFPLPEARHRRA